MEILVVPDIHGRDFWIEPCQNWQGSIVFLGDYHDPYPNQVSKESSLENLKELVKFVEFNKDRCTCLIGNHDCLYLNINIPEGGRFDYQNSVVIKELLNKLDLQWCKFVDNVVFSHAGILKEWLDQFNKKITDIPNIQSNDKALKAISPYRTGFLSDNIYKVGSIVWGDVREYNEHPHVEGYYQVFGHTQLNNEVIEEDYACLDCRKCFIIDTETKEIKEWKK